MSKKKTAISAIIILVLVITVPVLVKSTYTKGEQIDSVSESFESQAIPIKTASIESDDVYQSIYSLGTITSSEEYNVNSKAEGKVTKVNYNTGEYVKKGDTLFTLERDDFDVDKNSNLTQSKNTVVQAKLSFDTAKDNYTKYQSLYDNGAISKSDLDSAKSQYDNAKIGYENATKSYDTLKYNYDTKGDNYNIITPVSGIISNNNVAVGMDATYQTGFTIQVVDQYKVSSNVASKYINDLFIGQSAKIYVSTIGQEVMGKISMISLSGSNGSYPIEIQLDDGYNDKLKPGMYSDIWIIVDEQSQGTWIPSKSLIEDNGESYIYKVEDNKAKKIPVTVLYKTGDRIAVQGEISKDDKVITYGKEYVMNDSPVIIQ